MEDMTMVSAGTAVTEMTIEVIEMIGAIEMQAIEMQAIEAVQEILKVRTRRANVGCKTEG